MSSCLHRAGQIGWGMLGDYIASILLLYITMTKDRAYTHTSPQKALQVEVKFNGCLSGSLLQI